MKKINLFSCICFFLLLAGCLDDEGSYDYKDLRGPRWAGDPTGGLVWVHCRSGEVAKFRAHDYFSWTADSAQREKEVRYEWKLNGVVIGTEADFEIPTDELVAKIKLHKFHSSISEWEQGTLTIIDEINDVTFVAVTYINILASRAPGDFLILSEKGANSKLSFVATKIVDNKQSFVLEDDIYNQMNGSDIPGKPLNMVFTMGAKEISSIGSTTVMTDQTSVEINNESILKVGELKDQFYGAAPSDFKVIDRADAWVKPAEISETETQVKGSFSFLSTEDGRLFRRQRSAKNLSGKFQEIPYYIDELGYKIRQFSSRSRGLNSFACYDELNRRMIMISIKEDGEKITAPWGDIFIGEKFDVFKLLPVTMSPTGITDCPPVWNFPAGVTVLHVGLVNWSFPYYSFGVFYLEKEIAKYGEAVINVNTGICVQSSPKNFPWDVPIFSKIWDISGLSLDVKSVILTDVNKQKNIFYSIGNEINYINRIDNYKKYPFISDFGEKVTCMTYRTNSDYAVLVVGGENGKVVYYNISNLEEPKVITEMNVGGKVVSVKEIYDSPQGDAY